MSSDNGVLQVILRDCVDTRTVCCLTADDDLLVDVRYVVERFFGFTRGSSAKQDSGQVKKYLAVARKTGITEATICNRPVMRISRMLDLQTSYEAARR